MCTVQLYLYSPQCLYSTAISLLPLWAVRPVQSLSACTVKLNLYPPCGPYSLYRASVPVQGCTLPYLLAHISKMERSRLLNTHCFICAYLCVSHVNLFVCVCVCVCVFLSHWSPLFFWVCMCLCLVYLCLCMSFSLFVSPIPNSEKN